MMSLLRLLCLGLAVAWGSSLAKGLPDGFVYIDKALPGIELDIRYHTKDNFMGRPVKGYEAPRGIISTRAAAALEGVAQELKPFGLGLKVFDAYRPQRAVDDFVRWAEDPSDRSMKSQYYPNVAKAKLLPEGYIADRSGHSRGSTVDLTIVDLGSEGAKELDMGTRWDFFGPKSWPDSGEATPQQRANRLLLRTLMIKYGFEPLAQEWWHFKLANEPFPDTYFDFPVR